MVRTVSGLTAEELDDRCILLRGVKIKDLVVSRFLSYVLIENHPEVNRVRFKSQEVETWLKEHKNCVVDMKVFPYEWVVNSSSGTIYYFHNATVEANRYEPDFIRLYPKRWA